MHSGDRPARAVGYRVVEARTISDLGDAAYVRWAVFSEAMRLETAMLPALREVNGFDVLDSAETFVCYHGDDPAGTIRLLGPNPQLAAAHGVAFGLPLEIQFQADGLPAEASIAELGRAAIMPAHRGTPAIGRLYRAAYEASRRIGVTHWLGVSLTETDSLDDVRIVSAILARKGRTAPEPRLRPRAMPAAAGDMSLRPLYTASERLRAAAGDLDGLALPHTVRFLLGLGLTFVGEPVFEATFREYVLPCLLPLDAFAASAFGRRFVAERRAAWDVTPSAVAPLPAA